MIVRQEVVNHKLLLQTIYSTGYYFNKLGRFIKEIVGQEVVNHKLLLQNICSIGYK